MSDLAHHIIIRYYSGAMDVVQYTSKEAALKTVEFARGWLNKSPSDRAFGWNICTQEINAEGMEEVPHFVIDPRSVASVRYAYQEDKGLT